MVQYSAGSVSSDLEPHDSHAAANEEKCVALSDRPADIENSIADHEAFYELL